MSLSNRYGHVYKLYVDGELIVDSTLHDRPLQINFLCTLDFGGYMSYLDLEIYGLSRATESKAFKRDQRVVLIAGYTESNDIIFSGDIVNIFKEKNQAERLTRLICRSGAKKRRESILNKTFAKGSTLEDVLKACAMSLEYPLILKGTRLKNKIYSKGYTTRVQPMAELKELANINSFNWSISNDKLLVTADEEAANQPVKEIGMHNGMIGTPEITEEGLNVVTQLDPYLSLGGKYRTSSEYATFNFNNAYFQEIEPLPNTDLYKIYRLQHRGIFGQSWKTEITGFRQYE